MESGCSNETVIRDFIPSFNRQQARPLKLIPLPLEIATESIERAIRASSRDIGTQYIYTYIYTYNIGWRSSKLSNTRATFDPRTVVTIPATRGEGWAARPLNRAPVRVSKFTG